MGSLTEIKKQHSAQSGTVNGESLKNPEITGGRKMIYFNCDYNEGAHPAILHKLLETNMEQTIGYGEDAYCAQAAEIIQKLCKKEDAAVHFVVGGTQANLTVIDAALRPYQGALCAVSGHINVHETGAVEATGHKVLALPHRDGKITAAQVAEAMEKHLTDASAEHTVQPKLVYISSPTEFGTLYTKVELEALHETCRRYGLYLFLDGARMSYGLAASGNDVTLPVLADCCDVFYLGGTKCGALFGEAIVITNPELKQDFRYMIKQKGGMLAKGRLLGIQFLELLKDNMKMYMELAEHADRLADRIRAAFQEKGFELVCENTTNQIFVILPNAAVKALSEQFVLSLDQVVDDGHQMVRICTSWATKEEDADKLIQAIRQI